MSLILSSKNFNKCASMPFLTLPTPSAGRLCNGTMSVYPAVPSIDNGRDVQLVCRSPGAGGSYRLIAAGTFAGFWLGGSMPPCHLRRRKF